MMQTLSEESLTIDEIKKMYKIILNCVKISVSTTHVEILQLLTELQTSFTKVVKPISECVCTACYQCL